MVDLILNLPAERSASLFTRNFRVYAGIPFALYEGGPRAPVALIYGDTSKRSLEIISEHYQALIAIPLVDHDDIPERPHRYTTMTVKAPILASMQSVALEEFVPYVKTFEGDPLVFEGMTGDAPTMLFAADLIKATFRVLSGEVEKQTGNDRYGRHNPPSEDIYYVPSVSFYFNLIEKVIRYLYSKLDLPLFSLPRWPASAPMALFLSYDVDVVKKWTAKRVAYELALSIQELLRFRGIRLIKTIESLSAALKGRDPYWDFDKLLFLESENGFRSTWFFAPFGGDYNKRSSDIDPVYHRKPSGITSMIRRIIENDCEIALHGTRRAFLEADALKRQLDTNESRLGLKLLGVRHHYLMFRHGKTLEAAAQVGLTYDATLGFNDRPGFRNGMASPVFPFSADQEAGNIVEIPLHFMDGVFLNTDDDSESVKRQIMDAYRFARAAGGMFSVLVHPGCMDPLEIPALAQFYHSFIPKCRLDRCRSMTGMELCNWWLSRDRILHALECASNMWRIRGLAFPEDMDFAISAPNIKSMKFTVEGASEAFDLKHNSLVLRPKNIDPERGIAFIRER